MNSAGILMNIGAAATTGAPAADSQAGAGAAFTSAMAALQEDPAVKKAAAADALPAAPGTENVSALAIIASLLMQGAAPAANDAAPADADEEGANSDALTSAVSISTAADETAAPAPAANSRDTSLQDRAVMAQGMAMTADADDGADRDAGTEDVAITTDGANQAAGDKLQGTLASVLPAASASASASGVSTQSAAAAIHLATTLTRDGAADASATAHIIREPVGSPRWAEAIGSRLVLMSVRGQQEGSLTLTPEHLGPVEVQISVNKDTANVWFGAQHAETRAALADAMPRLRELLAASGLSLGQSGVSEQAPRRSAGEIAGSRSGGAISEAAGTTESAPAAWRPLRSGLIDTYA